MIRRPLRPILIIAGLLLVGLLLRIGYVLTLPNARLEPDESDYVNSARCLLSGGGFDQTVYYHVPPVPPILLAGMFSITGMSYTVARLFQCVLFIPAAWVTYLLGRELAGRLGGLVTLVLAAVYPYFIFFAGQVGTEAPAFVLIPATVLAALRTARDPSIVRAAGLGLLIALAALTRASVLYFILAVPIIFVLATGLRNLSWLRMTVTALTAFMAVYLPWCAVNRHYFGEWIPTPTIGGGVMLYQTALRMTMPDDAQRMEYLKSEILPKYYYPPGANHAQRLEGDRYLSIEGRRLIVANIDRYPAVVWHNLKRFWQFHPNYLKGEGTRLFYKAAGVATYGLLFPFLLFGAGLGLGRFRRLSAAYLFVAYFTMVHMALYGKLRYRIPMDPILLAFSALGALAALQRVAPQTLRKLEHLTGTTAETLNWRSP